VEVAQKVVNFSKEIQTTTAEELSELLKDKMKVKREQGFSEAAASDVGASVEGNVIHSIL